MLKARSGLLAVCGIAVCHLAVAQPVIIGSELTEAYYFVDHYEIMIDRPVEDVWPHLLDVAAWMYEFDNVLVSGEAQQEGAVMQLYVDQEFLIEIAKIIPEQLLLMVNHPSLMQGEESTGGISMLTLTDVNGRTLVANFMSRQFYWPLAGPNPLRERRQSEDFHEFNRALWQDKFLPKLKDLAESE